MWQTDGFELPDLQNGLRIDGTGGVYLWSSGDLKNWYSEGLILDQSNMETDAWYHERFWAPELRKIDGKFYLTVNCRNLSYGGKHSVCIAAADQITGPYEVLTKEEPAIREKDLPPHKEDPVFICNDASLYSEDGRSYLLFCIPEGIFAYEIEFPSCRLIGDVINVVRPSTDGWDTKIEGAYVMKYQDYYYCFYSSFTRSYEVGVSWSKAMEGPWEKKYDRPIMTPKDGITGCGHNSVFEGPVGKYWIAYHVETKEDPTEELAIDPLLFTKDGEVSILGPTTDRRKVEW